MKKTVFFVLIAITSLFIAACEPPPAANSNANTNTNTNAAKPAAAAPTADALLEMDKQATAAWMKGDSKFFETFLHDKFVMHEMGQQMGKAELVKMIATNKCEVKDDWKLEDPQMAKIDNDTYVLSYKGTFDGSCTGEDGKAMKNPPPAPAAAPAEKKDDAKKADSNTASNSNAASNSNSAAPAKPTPSSNTTALVKLHTEGWEAFKAKDAKKLTDMSTANLAIVDPMGMWISGQSAVVKQWTETMKCEGITNVSVTDGMATSLSPTVEILTLKGKADGTCDGQKNGTLSQTAVYVKEGDTWKLAFMFESPAM